MPSDPTLVVLVSVSFTTDAGIKVVFGFTNLNFSSDFFDGPSSVNAIFYYAIPKTDIFATEVGADGTGGT